MTPPKEGNVLLVEDNHDDEELALFAFRMNKIRAKITVARDGAEALDYLLSTGSHAGEPLPQPSMVLLDLKLPKIDGLEVLRRLRSDTRTRKTPVVILTTSSEPSDLERSMDLKADEYVRKPISFAEFMETTRRLAETWLAPSSDPGGSP